MGVGNVPLPGALLGLLRGQVVGWLAASIGNVPLALLSNVLLLCCREVLFTGRVGGAEIAIGLGSRRRLVASRVGRAVFVVRSVVCWTLVAVLRVLQSGRSVFDKVVEAKVVLVNVAVGLGVLVGVWLVARRLALRDRRKGSSVVAAKDTLP